MGKKPTPEIKTKKAPEAAEIELLPDTWERFERAVDKVAKSPPQHRTTKPVREDGAPQRKAKPSKEGR